MARALEPILSLIFLIYNIQYILGGWLVSYTQYYIELKIVLC